MHKICHTKVEFFVRHIFSESLYIHYKLLFFLYAVPISAQPNSNNITAAAIGVLSDVFGLAITLLVVWLISVSFKTMT